MNVFAKIFAQIFDSSISSDYVVRHVFMDLLVLADRDGVVDMTPDAIARRTNVPEDIVLHALEELSKADRKSRSDLEEGRRLVPLDSHRDWGWQIVNFEHYRQIRDEESRRAYFRDKKREYRKKSTPAPRRTPVSTSVLDSPTLSTQGEGEGDTEVELDKPPKSRGRVKAKVSDGCSDGLSPEMVAKGVGERLCLSIGYGPGSLNTAITEVARTEAMQGRNLEELAVEMEASYRYYEQEKPNLRIQWGPAKFFGEGHWRSPDSWPRSAKGKMSEREARKQAFLAGGVSDD